MAAGGELNARQRRHVHMHSTIFDDGGPVSGSLHKAGRQEELYERLKGTLGSANRKQPEIALPSAGDIKCTQLAGHAAVLPSYGAAIPQSPQSSRGLAKATTSPEVLVYDGEAKPVLRAAARDHGAIPKEFWATSVNLQWHDTRNEKCRDKGAALNRSHKSSQELKRQELSSEVFGKARLMEASTVAPSQDLMADTADYLKMDSALHARSRPSDAPAGGRQPEAVAARDRLHQNLASSTRNVLPGPEVTPQAPAVPSPQEVEYERRRRQEKNFSDLFGTQMGERRELRNREEVIATRSCSFLDTRAEIATRNKDHWRSQEETGAASRKEAERNSRLFDHQPPEKPALDPQTAQVQRDERAIWDSAKCMQTAAEVARRRRMKQHAKDFEDVDGHTHMTRKQEDMASEQVRRNLNAPQAPKFSTSPRPQRLGETTMSPKKGPSPQEREQLLRSAKDTKIASLQSNIFS